MAPCRSAAGGCIPKLPDALRFSGCSGLALSEEPTKGSINASACPLLQDNAARAACTGTGIGTGTSPGQVVPGA